MQQLEESTAAFHAIQRQLASIQST